MFYRILIYFFLLLLTSTSFANSLENKILFKVNNEIITSIDILNEINYLHISNSESKKLKKNIIIEIAKNNLIKDKIKKIELLNNISEISIDEKYLNNLITKNFQRSGFRNLEEYKNFLRINGFNIKKLKEKITLDMTWRQFIYEKYKNRIKINKVEIRKNISEEKIKLFNLSEILFNLNENENKNTKFKKIETSIKEKGFKNSASLFSLSDSSANGGDLGWINSSVLSEKILKELNLIKKNEYTKPIQVPSGFLILKINDHKEEQKNIDINKEVNRVINSKINNQLNQYSNIYITRLKNLIINEM